MRTPIFRWFDGHANVNGVKPTQPVGSRSELQPAAPCPVASFLTQACTRTLTDEHGSRAWISVNGCRGVVQRARKKVACSLGRKNWISCESGLCWASNADHTASQLNAELQSTHPPRTLGSHATPQATLLSVAASPGCSHSKTNSSPSTSLPGIATG